MVIDCAECGEEAHRLPDVGDCWLDAGIVPFSTLGWHHDTYVERGYAKGAGEGVTMADLPDHADWEDWFPADWVSEMREQIRLWFYSMLFMRVALVGPRALPAGAHLREGERRDRPAHAQVVGQRDLVRRRGRDDGRRRDALDVLRAEHRPRT